MKLLPSASARSASSQRVSGQTLRPGLRPPPPGWPRRGVAQGAIARPVPVAPRAYPHQRQAEDNERRQREMDQQNQIGEHQAAAAGRTRAGTCRVPRAACAAAGSACLRGPARVAAHSLQEPGYSLEPARPAISMASRLWQRTRLSRRNARLPPAAFSQQGGVGLTQLRRGLKQALVSNCRGKPVQRTGMRPPTGSSVSFSPRYRSGERASTTMRAGHEQAHDLSGIDEDGARFPGKVRGAGCGTAAVAGRPSCNHLA